MLASDLTEPASSREKLISIKLKILTTIDMSDKDDDSTDQSLARNRSRRATSKKKANRFEALEKLKAAKNKEWKYEVEEELKDNVYDIVDERKYAERVKER